MGYYPIPQGPEEVMCVLCQYNAIMAALALHRKTHSLPDDHPLTGGVNIPGRKVMIADPADPKPEPTVYEYTFAELGVNGCA